MDNEAKRTRGQRKDRSGVVVSRSGSKTIIVRVERRGLHPVYGKVVRTVRKFHVHDEKNEAAVGDHVRIEECRPMSRTKCWRLLDVTRKGGAAEPAKDGVTA